jgi:outer membrane protein TolC
VPAQAAAQAPPAAAGEEELPLAPPARTLTLAEALAYARTHQPQVRAALARIAAEKARAEIPRGQRLPTVGVTAQVFGGSENNTTASYVAPWFMDIPRIGGTRGVATDTSSLTPYGSTLAGAGATLELFDFGRIAAQAAAADALVVVRKHDADAIRLDIDFTVEEAFFSVQAARAVLAAANGAFERSRVHRDLAQAGVRSGLRPPIELTRAEADLQRFDIGRIRARGGLATAQAVFASAIGAPEPALDAVDTTLALSDVPALAEAIRLASSRQPRIQAAVAQLKAQEERTRAIGAELRPDLSLTGTVSGRAGGAPPTGGGDRPVLSGWVPSVPNYDAGLVLTWPLFDGTIDARRSASRADEQVRRDEIDVVRQDLVAEVERAYVGVEVAKTTLPGLQRAVLAAIANYAQADARFRAGLGTSVELADAEALRASTEIDAAIGAFELARARAAFGRAIAEGL